MKELELLQEKLQQLLKHHNAVQSDLDRLKKINEKQSALIEQQKTEIVKVQQELTLKSVAYSAGSMEGDKEKLKQHLDLVIREIEKNIESL
ncbi:hypothetical protein F0919_02555 [Taibaiella lutea]|uniref:Uncharacterized protein n=1 Tax=Taibaiella lutea TaxID=2608001 RepID=A0A5M6CTS8_9BACT|nr:hypothetical protein [Taibaiella lutea]KAA5536569.1 hypothetical protein F0919_02555 [Taibaiella lutea]